MKLIHGSSFSGLGGFDLAAQYCGMENAFHIERDKFCQRVLKYYWPNAQTYEDITTADLTIWRRRIDIYSGGFPCQPFSDAGLKKATEDERHLWPEMFRTILQLESPWILAENVPGIISSEKGLVFEQVLSDLENAGYEVLPIIIPAASVQAPHIRSRIWIVAYSHSFGVNRWAGTSNRKKKNTKKWSNIFKQTIGFGDFGFITDTMCNGRTQSIKSRQSELTNKNGPEGRAATNSNFTGSQQQSTYTFSDQPRQSSWFSPTERFEKWPTQSPICGGNDGIPRELDGIALQTWRRESIKGYGNAICPQVAVQIFEVIQQVTKQLIKEYEIT